MMACDPQADDSAEDSSCLSFDVGAKYGPHSNQIRPRPGCRSTNVVGTSPDGTPASSNTGFVSTRGGRLTTNTTGSSAISVPNSSYTGTCTYRVASSSAVKSGAYFRANVVICSRIRTIGSPYL